jgi:hypothetical protein
MTLGQHFCPLLVTAVVMGGGGCTLTTEETSRRVLERELSAVSFQLSA